VTADADTMRALMGFIAAVTPEPKVIAAPLDPDLEAHARMLILCDAEEVVWQYVNGRITSTSVPYLFARISDLRGTELQAAFEHACDAFTTWELSEGPQSEWRAMEPELAHPEVYAERCRALLDDALEALCGGAR
jgi:hypothetical protein